MPKHLQTNFTAGEISPKTFGRVDVQRYMNGAESMENCIVNIHGGAERRPGTLYEGETKHHDRRSRLIPFVYSTSEAYVLEIGDLYLRVFRAGGGQITNGGSVYEVATPYPVAMIDDLDYTQGADTMFLFHEDYPTQVLRRLAEDNWQLQDAPFTVIPFAEIGSQPEATLVFDSVTPGTDITVNASAAVFLPTDVGRRITYGSGVAEITGFTSDTEIEVEIKSAFPSAAIPEGWVLEDSPQAALAPSEKGTVGKEISLAFESTAVPDYGPDATINGVSWVAGSVFVTTDMPHGFSVNDTVQIRGIDPANYSGTFRVITTPNPSTFSYYLPNDPGSPTGLGICREVTTIHTSVLGWRPEDVGKFVRINRGLVLLTEFVSPTEMKGIIRQELDADVAAPANAWTLESPVWNAEDGYPRTGCFYEQRLALASTKRNTQTIWGSRSGLFYDFTIGVEDDDAFSFALPSTGQINPISQLLSTAVLVPLTYGGEYTMMGGVEKPLAPTNVQCKPRTAYGCSRVKPVRVGSEVLFVQRAGRKVRGLSYDPDTARYAAPDLTVMSEHITQSGVTGMAYQAEPRSLVWATLANGRGAVLALDRDEGVVAWTPISTQGQFESFATVPTPTGDEVWAIVRREINGQERRFVERFVDGQFLDSAVIGSSPTGALVWSGLDHLEGAEVSVRGDGTYLGEFTVTNGQITLEQPVQQVEVGLPFTNRIRLLRPEIMTQIGTMQGAKMGATKLSLLMLEAQGLVINGDPIEFRTFDTSRLDMPPDMVVADFVGLSLTGWYEGKVPIEIVQDQPYPFHLLSVVLDFSAN